MICCHSYTNGSVSFSDAWGPLYETEKIDLGSWPATFKSGIYYAATNFGSGGWWIESMPNKYDNTSCGKVYLVSGTNATRSVSMDIIGIGKWK